MGKLDNKNPGLKERKCILKLKTSIGVDIKYIVYILAVFSFLQVPSGWQSTCRPKLASLRTLTKSFLPLEN